MKNKTRYTILNLNKEKILNEILKKTRVYNLKIEENNISFSIDEASVKDVDKILERKNIKMLSKKHTGALNFLKNSILKWGIIIPIFIFFVFMLIMNNFVFKVLILGNENVSSLEITKAIYDCGFSGFLPKFKVDTVKIENQILKIDKVSLVSAIIKGNTLVINIKEKVYNPEYEDKDGFLPLKSKFNGIITEINLIQGTPLVSVGQTVEIGQELVSPCVIDTSGQTLNVRPLADIKADVFYVNIVDVPDTKIEEVETGNKQTVRTVFVGKIPIFEQKDIPKFKNYKSFTEEKVIVHDNLLPIKEQVTYYCEIEYVTIDNYFQNNSQSILEEVRQKTRQQTLEYEIIKNEYHTITSNCGINRITYTVVVNKSIF